MKKKYLEVSSLDIIYKTQELLEVASNRYKITVQVANKAKRKRYEDIDILNDMKIKPVIRAILEMNKEINSLYVARISNE
uniref:DNA-directed RNA polymerase omega chain n=1 Tax=Cryptomonas gyropyrenoidosa TaxID=233257 RepID=UPI0027A0D27E|nr:DNA-directed RNA polymerase omega chain [Cryptomonas gyropyrenoidosa]WFQ82927.1 DNA-directed RNA polymerase omega chain [Cryptomonas gyropyrenoidosa]